MDQPVYDKEGHRRKRKEEKNEKRKKEAKERENNTEEALDTLLRI